MSDGWPEYRVTAQRAEDSNDARGTCVFEGTNFSDVVQRAKGDGYPRVIDAEERRVTAWHRVQNYPFAEATP